ncbi:transportin-3 [Bicyclus anynana]|uniref:Transportin-3 n=1 Tax=Bicyclus anynana TaxID=110368 RepID=A0A6J1N607_BICAN|nr:transportin-3 [Bicyclus anynana]
MESPSMDTIYQAISALYDNPNGNEKEKASTWLGDVQKSIHSWKVADQLLQQKKDVQSCFFAAQTMRSKVQHNLSELPQEAVVSLRDSLVAHLEGITPDTSPPILTQLSLALADLALQMLTWQNCVSDLIKLFSNKNYFVLLEILTVLPQEIDSSSLKLGENRREEIKSELRANSQDVTFFLKECINSNPNSHIALKIIKCMTSWIQVKAISIQEVPQNAVIGFSLQVLQDHTSINMLHDAASDCICAILHCLENNSNNTEVEQLLFDNVSKLETSYHMVVAHEEEEKAANYARVFTELAETFLGKIILSTANGSAHFAMRALELVLMCVGHHDYEVAKITFNLWYRLSEEVYERDYQPLTDAFKPHIERLIEALARHCQCEPDLMQLPEEDEFFDFRMKVMELIKDVVFIVSSSCVFRQMFATLQADLSWEQTEAALFIMQAVAKNILPEEYEYVPKVVEAILSMPENSHPAVRKTCILLLGELCDWIERHPECLEASLQHLIRALHDQKLANAAAVALQSICQACRSHAAPHASTLLQAARLADELELPLHTSSTLMRALAAAIGRLPHDQLTVAMREATALQLGGLRALLAGGKELRKGTSADPVLWLDRLAALFRDVDVLPAAGAPPTAPPAHSAHPAVPAFRDAWPVVNDVMNKYVSDGRVMERACRCVRFMVRGCGRPAAALLPALAAALPQLYAARAHSCVLYLCAVLCDALDAPDARPALARLLHAVLPRALALLDAPAALRDNPDTVDDLFRLCVRYLQRNPSALVEGDTLGPVLQCAVAACALDHSDANCSLMKFLQDLTRLAASTRTDDQHLKGLVSAALMQYGETLTYALLEASVLHLHSYMLSEVADVLLEMLQWQKSRGVDWLQSALRRLPRAPPAATEHQCWQFHQYAMRAEKCKEMTRLLRDFARLYR